MRPDSGFEDRGQNDEQAEEEDGRDDLGHSFSPLLSTA